MLAPRKKLWSTPLEVVDRAIELLAPKEGDVVWDIGAGDGRFLLRCAEITRAQCIGVEIDEERGQQACLAIAEMQYPEGKCHFIIGNALEQDYSLGTSFFLYLVPRGLRIILPILRKLRHKIRVVTYMAPFPEEVAPTSIVKVSTASHPEAQWPLYVYGEYEGILILYCIVSNVII